MEQHKRAGQRGEQITKKETKKLGPDFLRINSRRLSLGRVSQNAELDHILIWSAGVFVIDSKNWRGEITFKNPGITQVRPDGTKEEFNGDKDPTSQLEHQTYVVAQALNQLGLPSVPIYGVMAFTNENCTLKNELPKFTALKVKDLNQYVLSKNKNVLSPDQKNTILNYLLDKSRDSDTYNETGSRSTNQKAGTSNSYRRKTSDAPHIRNSIRLQNRKVLKWVPIVAIAIIVGAILISNHTRGIASTGASTNAGTNESTATTQTSNVSSLSDTSTNSSKSSTSASKESVERNLRSISDAIVTGKTTSATANQSTLDAFKEYYAITGTWAQGFNQDMPTWGQIHDELLQAYQNEQQNDQYLLKFNWQTIQGDIISLQGQ